MSKNRLRLWNYLVGGILLFFGLMAWVSTDPKYGVGFFKERFSFKPFKDVVALPAFVLGAWSIWGGMKKNPINLNEPLICPECEELSTRRDVHPECLCPACGGTLEPLEGYYDRHPERRDEDKRQVTDQPEHQ